MLLLHHLPLDKSGDKAKDFLRHVIAKAVVNYRWIMQAEKRPSHYKTALKVILRELKLKSN